MNGNESSYLIGILLKPDGFKFQNEILTQNDGVAIGSVMCSNLSMLCNEFRQLITAKVSFVPQKFQFLSKNGWPIEKSEEGSIEISHLLQSGTVAIQKYFDLPRLGIKWADGNWIGFIFVSFNSYLSEIRVKIHEDLGNKLQGSDFEFFTKNECPVSRAQEYKLCAWDICDQNFCILNKLADSKKIDTFNNQNHRSRKRPSRFNNNKVLIKKKSLVKNDNPNSILISYVHCEATMHARNLKAELQNMGLDSVFLDIDDIPPGQDWQDVINNALNNCTAFVALVTPRYGETKWTNREAKLADDKEKHIIPVSFLDRWPPDQLAIQFLSLQYIPWKIPDERESDKDSTFDDISSWDQRCVHRVAKEIKKICMEQEVSTPDSLSLLDSKPMLSNGSLPFYSPTEPQRNKDKVVISAHSTQKQFVEKITTMLKEESYEVWSSVDFADNCGDFDFLCDDSHSQSPDFDAYCHDKAYTNATMNKLNQFSCPDSKTISQSARGHEYENLKNMKFNFRRQVKEASFVIVVMSEDYYKSKICLQQAYYCEQRVDVVVIKYGKFDIDNVFLNFFPEQDMLKITEDQDENTIFGSLKKEIIKILHEGTSRKSYKDQIQALVKDLSSKLKIDTCVYVIGGTSGVSKNAEQFCIHLGAELAKLVNLTLVTEGFFGAGDLVGRNFCEEKEIKAKGQRHSIYHIIPYKDHNINARRVRQKDDGSFEKIPYGQTLFYGHSISERDDIVSSTFKICLLIEGGERSACLAEKFLWNDCIVIPVIFNNRAITSKRCLAESLKKVPSGVNPIDWSVLNEYSAPDALAKTVKKIVTALLRKVLLKPVLTKQSIKIQSTAT